MTRAASIQAMRLEQADHIMAALDRVTAAGYSVRFSAGEVTVSKPGTQSFTICRRELRDGAAHALQSLLLELDMARTGT